MSISQNDPLLQAETTCKSLLQELQIIWGEVGESETEKDRMLFEIDQECLDVYRRKVDKANRSRAQLRQEIADCEAELAAICLAMAERPVHMRQSDQKAGSLKEELARIHPELEEMRKRKLERRNHFVEVQEQIQSTSNEIYGLVEYIPAIVDETDLSLRKLEELHRQLHALQKEKSDRLKKVQEHLYTLNSLCSVLGLNFKQTASGVHPSLGNSEGSKSVNNDTIGKLVVAIQELREVKLQRMQKLQDLATTMLELWNLMDTPIEDQQRFQNVTSNIAASEHEVTEPNTLSEDFINYVEAEVSRLEELKSSKMKELVLKKRAELEEICRRTRLIPEIDSEVENAVEAIESGSVDPVSVLERIELQIAQVKEEAFSRKEILEKVEKWLSACDEESWLEEYNKDENRYNAGRGTHLTLKRAEKARALVNKIPAMVDNLTSKTVAWEKDRGAEFMYDDIRLLCMLEDYTLLRQEKEQERRRHRDLKKLQGQLIAEQEVIYGSKSPLKKSPSVKKTPRTPTSSTPRTPTGIAASRRVSTPRSDLKSTLSCTPKKTDKVHQIQPLNYLDDDGDSYISSARRGLNIADVTGIPMRKCSFGAGSVQDVESPLTRQPFSPVCSTVSSKSNVANAADEENITPKAMPPTPSSVPFRGDLVQVQEIEYSFEERRLGYVLA
ncbi:65-kDa microtubule-associated protein 3-like isoform X2 [Lotus japonicus]|uniref:65-kDa microtubule-associated protein 3-like isoform X2 n=1 Tax=Lotus japonicus TaxID=34305 RepID=UPI002587B5E6|nr:65-kDa microtubule-associated protein 3-like isoform X2 [Lotus japonicus]